MRNSIRTRLAAAFVCLAIIPLLLMGLVLGWQSFQIQQQQALSLQSQIAQRVSTAVAAFIQELENELRVVVGVQGLYDLSLDQQTIILSKLLSLQKSFDELILLDGEGQKQIHLSRHRVVPAADLGDCSQAQEFLVPSESGESFYSPVRFDETTGEPLMTIAIPLLNPRSGIADGVLVAETRNKKLWDLIAGMRASEGESVYVVDAQGRLIAHRNPSVVLRGSQFDVPDRDGIHTGLNGTRVALASDSVQFGGQVFTIVTEKPISQALNLAINTVIITSALTVIALILAIGLGFLVVRQIVQPVSALAATAQAIAAGDLSQQADVARSDEIGVLAVAFNSMTARLRELIGSLEQRVAERTAELTAANEQLQSEIRGRKRAEEALQQREAILGAIALAAEKFLRPSDWEQGIQVALDYLGKAADVSRVIIWEASTSDDGKYLANGRYEWLAPQAEPAPLVGLQNVPVFRRWRDLLPRGEIIAGHVKDFGAREQEFFAPRGIKSALVVPIFVNDAWWGFVGFDESVTEREWTEAEIGTLKTAASILGGALERKQAEEELQRAKTELERQNVQLEALYHVGQMVNSTLETDAILDRLTDEAMRVTRATHGQVLVVRQQEGYFERRSQRGFSPEEVERAQSTSLPLDQGINARAYLSHQAVRMDDVQAKPGYFPLIPTTRTELAVPIIRDGQVLGNLDLQSPEAGAFRDVDLGYLNALADQVALALNNARLFEQAQQEIAERKQTEKALRASEEQFRLLAESSLVGIFILQDMTFRYVNPTMAKMLDYKVADLLGGLGLLDLTYHQDHTAAESYIRKCLSGQTEVAPLAIRALHKDGTLIDCEVLATSINYRDKPAMIGTILDVTERKRAEEALKTYAARLERSTHELQDFLYVASHDLQEPLRKVQTFGGRLRSKYAHALGDQGRDYLTRLQNAASHMHSLLDALSSYSRVLTGTQAFVPVDLAQLVRKVVVSLETRIAQVDGCVEVGDLPTIEADPTQMRQLLQHLIGNALKFHRPDVPPVVKICGQRVKSPTGQPNKDSANDEFCQITVQDNGIGFDEQHLDRIFQVFQRLHSRREYEGAGAGLTTCRKIVERHGGTLTARSTPGQGATFVVTLPIQQSGKEIGSRTAL